MKRKTLLEGSLVVEMKNGDHRILTCSPFGGKVYHNPAGAAFGKTEITDESEFRRSIRRIVSRSSYDKR